MNIDTYIQLDGTVCQLEDWHDKNTKEMPDLYGYTIAAYMKDRYGMVRCYRIARTDYKGYSNEKVKRDWETIKKGSSFRELWDYYWANKREIIVHSVWLFGTIM